MIKSKAYKKWLKRVQDVNTPWTENEIIYFRKAVGSSGLKCKLEREELRDLFWDVVSKCDGYKITLSQTVKGIDYLKNTIFKKNGSLRNTAQRRIFGDKEIDIVKNFSHFKFSGIWRASSNSYDFFTPIYEVVSKDGSRFEYTTNMGQMQITG